jgi:hypothetical protein
MGRPPRLTPERQARFLQALRACAFPLIAARHAGISPATFYRAMQGTTRQHAAFRDEVVRTQTELELRLVGIIVMEAGKNARWALSLLERRFSSRWGRRAAADDGMAEAGEAATGATDELVTIDADFIEALVPRLLEAGRQLSGRSVDGDPVDVSVFEDDGEGPSPADEDDDQ